jgi:hypothetical protein
MKNLTRITFAALMAIFVLQGCEKAHLQDITTETKISPEVDIVQSDTVTAKSDITASTSDTLQLVPITNDVTIAVSYYRDPTNGKVRINFTPFVYLNNYYCRNAIMQFKSAVTADNNFNLHLVNIRESKGCAISAAASSPGPSTAANNVFISKFIGSGTYPLKITVGSVAYNGSIVVAASNVTFNWSYTSGVVFPNKVLPQ